MLHRSSRVSGEIRTRHSQVTTDDKMLNPDISRTPDEDQKMQRLCENVIVVTLVALLR